MIGSKGPIDALAQSIVTLIDPDHQLGGKIPFDPSITV